MSEPPEVPKAAPDEDEPLVRAARQGDRDAFRALYEKYLDRVFATAARIVGDRDLATDLAQEVFVKVFEELGAFRFGSRFSTWLYRIAANHAINKANELSRRARIHERIARERSPAAGPSTPPGAGAGNRFEDERLQAALDGLSPKLRAVVVLRYLEGLSYEEIAEALDLSLGTVKSRLFLAHATLRPLMEEIRESES